MAATSTAAQSGNPTDEGQAAEALSLALQVVEQSRALQQKIASTVELNLLERQERLDTVCARVHTRARTFVCVRARARVCIRARACPPHVE